MFLIVVCIEMLFWLLDLLFMCIVHLYSFFLLYVVIWASLKKRDCSQRPSLNKERLKIYVGADQYMMRIQ